MTTAIGQKKKKKKIEKVFLLVAYTMYNGNRTVWSAIRSVIIRVINDIGRLRSGSRICLITRMITDRIG